MKALALWPVLTQLKRIAAALERANELELHRQEMEFPRMGINREAKPKKVVISKRGEAVVEGNMEGNSYTGV